VSQERQEVLVGAIEAGGTQVVCAPARDAELLSRRQGQFHVWLLHFRSRLGQAGDATQRAVELCARPVEGAEPPIGQLLPKPPSLQGAASSWAGRRARVLRSSPRSVSTGTGGSLGLHPAQSTGGGAPVSPRGAEHGASPSS
jgi:hypothetical protein